MTVKKAETEKFDWGLVSERRTEFLKTIRDSNVGDVIVVKLKDSNTAFERDGLLELSLDIQVIKNGLVTAVAYINEIELGTFIVDPKEMEGIE